MVYKNCTESILLSIVIIQLVNNRRKFNVENCSEQLNKRLQYKKKEKEQSTQIHCIGIKIIIIIKINIYINEKLDIINYIYIKKKKREIKFNKMLGCENENV